MQNFKKDDKSFFYKNALFGSVIALIVTAIAYLLIAVFMVVLDIGSTYASPLSSIGVALGGFVGTMIAARKNGQKGMLTGLLCSLILFGTIMIVAAFLSDRFTIMTLIHFIVTLASCLMGGIVGVNKSEKRKII